jgi:cytochrome c biogenesis protein CcdA
VLTAKSDLGILAALWPTLKVLRPSRAAPGKRTGGGWPGLVGLTVAVGWLPPLGGALGVLVVILDPSRNSGGHRFLSILS